MSDKIKGISPKTIRWQCSGCDHLCALLLDSLVKPANLVHLAKCGTNQKWRIVNPKEGGIVDASSS